MATTMADTSTATQQGTAMEITVSKFDLLRELTATHGAGEFPGATQRPGQHGDQSSGEHLEDAYREDNLCHLFRGIALHAEWFADGDEGGVDRHGGHGWPPPGVHREQYREILHRLRR